MINYNKLKVYLDTSVVSYLLQEDVPEKMADINECNCIISWNPSTIEDIHKIREYHYELTKDMETQEKINFYNEGGRTFLKEMEKRKIQKV